MRLSPIAMILAGAIAALPAAAETFTFAAMGDTPYRLPGDMKKFDRLIDRVNTDRPAFSIHVGDIKSGGTQCTDEAFQAIHDRFMRIEGAIFYTPGDNEWTDCHRRKAGEFDPRERLAKLRRMFFPEARSLGQKPINYARQSDEGQHAQMVENAIWRHRDVVFATVHVVGSNNGLERNAASVAEYELRDRANIDWLKRAFREAHDAEARAMVIAIHADPLFEVEKPWDYQNSGFKATLRALAEGAKNFERPVLLIHGDSHEFIIDKPLRDQDGKRVQNVTRLEVMGGNDVGAVFVTVDTKATPPWAFNPVVIE